jgi:hypothetical protein
MHLMLITVSFKQVKKYVNAFVFALQTDKTQDEIAVKWSTLDLATTGQT